MGINHYTINEKVSKTREEVQQELASGKYVETTEELYAFLENYSS